MKLLELLLTHPQQAADFHEKPGPVARNWLFKTYGECLRAVTVGGRVARARGGERLRGEGREAGGGAGATDATAGLTTAAHDMD